MTQFLRKNAKLLYILFAVFAFAFIIIACVFMTPYSDIALDYKKGYSVGDEPYVYFELSQFVVSCGLTMKDYKVIYEVMYQANQALQLANKMVFYLSVVSFVMIAIMLICANASRKKYYISNLVSGVACPAVIIIMGIVTIVFIAIASGHISNDTNNWLGLGSMVNAAKYDEAIELYLEKEASEAALSTTSLSIYMVLIGIFIVASGALIAYNVFRYLDTKKQLRAEAETDTTHDEQEVVSDEAEEVSLEKVVDANV